MPSYGQLVRRCEHFTTQAFRFRLRIGGEPVHLISQSEPCMLHSVCCHLGPRFSRTDCTLFAVDSKFGPAASAMSALLFCAVLILVWELVKRIVQKMWAWVMTWTYETPPGPLAVVAHLEEVDVGLVGPPVCLHQCRTARGANLHWRQIRCLDCDEIIAGWATPFPLPGDGCLVMKVD